MTTISEAANVLGVSEKTVRRRIKDGSLPAQLVGEPPRYEIADEAIASLASALPSSRDGWSEEISAMLSQLADALQGQLKEKDRQLEEKDRQIRELHVLLQTSQEHLSRAMLPAPAPEKMVTEVMSSAQPKAAVVEAPPAQEYHAPAPAPAQAASKPWWKIWG